MIIRNFTPNESNAFFNVNLHFKMPHYALRSFARKSHSYSCLPMDFLSDPLTAKRPPVHSACQRVRAVFPESSSCALCGTLPVICPDPLTRKRLQGRRRLRHLICQTYILPPPAKLAAPEGDALTFVSGRPPPTICQRVSGVLTRQQHQAQASLQQSSLRLDCSRRSSYIAATVQ